MLFEEAIAIFISLKGAIKNTSLGNSDLNAYNNKSNVSIAEAVTIRKLVAK